MKDCYILCESLQCLLMTAPSSCAITGECIVRLQQQAQIQDDGWQTMSIFPIIFDTYFYSIYTYSILQRFTLVIIIIIFV